MINFVLKSMISLLKMMINFVFKAFHGAEEKLCTEMV